MELSDAPTLDHMPGIAARLGATAETPLPVVVFVHGIYSRSATAFPEMYHALEGIRTCALYDYDFHDSLQKNGMRLALGLARLNNLCRVTLICHSMGGLVGRLAILTGGVSCVQRIFLLGTPNFGALRTAQLGLAAQLMLGASGVVYGLFRKPGLADLTRVNRVFREPLAKGAQHADTIEYITIPGEFFHDSREFFDLGPWREFNAWRSSFGAISFSSEVLSATMPFWKVGLERPHDGIVETRSNTLLNPGSGRHSEKDLSILHPERIESTYAHIHHTAVEGLTHVEIQHNPEVVEMVKQIVEAPSLRDWEAKLDAAALRKIKVTRS